MRWWASWRHGSVSCVRMFPLSANYVRRGIVLSWFESHITVRSQEHEVSFTLS